VIQQRQPEPDPVVENKYAKLPPRPRPEDLRTSHDVVAYGEPVGEADRDRDWLLRTAGVFI
jgi:hypothetical protein